MPEQIISPDTAEVSEADVRAKISELRTYWTEQPNAAAGLQQLVEIESALGNKANSKAMLMEKLLDMGRMFGDPSI